MEKYQFKTNIKCGACIAKVTPFLNALESIENWEVNTDTPEKVLTVNATEPGIDAIKDALSNAGFKAEQI